MASRRKGERKKNRNVIKGRTMSFLEKTIKKTGNFKNKGGEWRSTRQKENIGNFRR